MPGYPRRLEAWFLTLSAIGLCAGTSLGVYMGVLQDFTFRPVHAHLNLLTWVSLAIFGLFYRVYPAAARRRLASAHLLISGTSAALFPIGLWFELSGRDHVLLVIGVAGWLTGTLIFLVTVVGVTRSAEAA